MKFEPLDPLLNNPLRLAVMSILISVVEADFNYLKEKTEATSGNLSVQITKLEEAGFIEVHKGYQGKLPRTTCKVTKAGARAFQEYFYALKSYLP